MHQSDYQAYLQTDQWKCLRVGALEKAGRRCQVCNTPDDLDVHHRTYERVGNEQIDDLTVLCNRCHGIFHEQTQVAKDPITIELAVDDAYRRLDARKKKLEKLQTSGVTALCSGITTGFVELDQLTGGLQNSELIIVAGRPCSGKTTFVLNVARHLAINEKLPLLLVSLDQSRAEIADALLCGQAAIRSHWMRNGSLGLDDQDKLHTGAELLADSKLIIDDSGAQSIMRLLSAIRSAKQKHGIGLVIIDCLQQIDFDFRRDKADHFYIITRRLKLLARELGIVIIATSQLQRTNEDRQDHRPRLADIREQAIEQNSDMIIFLHMPANYEPGQSAETLQVTVAKQRNGPSGILCLIFDRETMRMMNIAPDVK